MWINSGKLYYGSYLNNEKNGLGIFFCGLSKSWVGYWKDGYKDGPGINITEGNIMRNELWKNGRKNESECDINNVMFDEIQLFYEKAQKELFEK